MLKKLDNLGRFSLFIVCLNFLSFSEAAEDSPLVQAIKVVVPENISELQVAEDETRVRITGKTADNQNVASYLRLLDEKIKSPNLESITQENGHSVFVITIKK